MKVFPFLLAFGACAPERNEETDLNACTLLLAEDITSVLGNTVYAGVRDDQGLIAEGEQAGVYSSTCLWQLDRDNDVTEYVILMAMRWPPDKPASQFLQDFRHFSDLGVIAQQPVALALGDEALWWGDGVAVVKGRVSFGISTRLLDTPERRRAAEEAFATQILSRLQ